MVGTESTSSRELPQHNYKQGKVLEPWEIIRSARLVMALRTTLAMSWSPRSVHGAMVRLQPSLLGKSTWRSWLVRRTTCVFPCVVFGVQCCKQEFVLQQ